MKQYKILTQQDKYFHGKFDPEKLEEVLNQYAKEGWIVITITTQDFRTMLSRKVRQEMIVVLERSVR